ncbi:MAG: HD domain-containing protein [Thermomicrobiales bacterium]|nr:HD domain-containing protein [Thermomicrobiales bacterium]
MSTVEIENRILNALFDRIDRADRRLLTGRMRELDSDLWRHARLVATISELLAIRLGVNGDARSRLVDAAWLHDIGKLTIPRTILDKPGPLNEREWEEIREHPIHGAVFFGAEVEMVDIEPLVRHHHERFDGAGYPDRLAGTAIPLGARIICVVDAFDAMTTDRSYRASCSIDAALSELERCAGTQFDPAIVEVLVGLVSDLKRDPTS